MKIYSHNNYDDYVSAQIEKNKKKINNVWVKESELNLIVKHIKSNISKITFGICHGVRNGYEVKKFREKLGIKVIGTDISDTASNFMDVIQWDFHKVKNEWINNVDFIYSNSFDHSFKPEECLDSWMKCLKKNGICYIHQDISNKKIDAADCFVASKGELEKLFNTKYNLINEIFIRVNRCIFCIKNK